MLTPPNPPRPQPRYQQTAVTVGEEVGQVELTLPLPVYPPPLQPRYQQTAVTVGRRWDKWS